MKKILQNSFLKKLKKYRKLKNRLEKLVAGGTFYSLSHKQQSYFLSRLNRLFQSLRVWATQYKTGLVATAFVAMSGLAQGQSHTFVEMTTNPFPKALNLNQTNHNATFVDIDGDNDQDFFSVQGGNIYYFRNPGTGLFTERTGSNNPFDTITNASSVAFMDFDADSDQDVFILKNDSITLFKNNGSFSFSMASDAENPFASLSGLFNPQLCFVDFDGDTDKDAFIVDNDAISYYKNFSGTYTIQTGTNNPFNGVTTVSDIDFVDVDGDSDLDAFLGNKLGGISYYRNDSGSYSAVTSPITSNDTPVGNRTFLDIADLDKDGKDDLLLMSRRGYLHYYNNAQGFAEVASKTSPIAGGYFLDHSFNQVDFVDLDSDGDQDAVIVVYMDQLICLENDGNGNFSNMATTAFNSLSNINNLAFYDIDSDGDEDLFLGNRGAVQYFENVSGVFTFATPTGDPFNGITTGHTYHAAITFGDMDGDGDKDAFLPTNTSGTLYFENNGGVLTQKTGETVNPVNSLPTAGDYSLAFHDMDSDGDEDVFTSEYYSSGTVSLYLTQSDTVTGAENFTINPFDAIDKTQYYPQGIFADIDGDGKDEAFFGGEDFTGYKRTAVSAIFGATASTESGKIFSYDNIVSLREIEGNGSMAIYNLSGNMVYQSKVKPGDSQYILSGNPAGIYLVRLALEGNDAMLTRKVYLK
jgi:hypothetical protein